MRRTVVASPLYLARREKPKVLRHIAGHDALIYSSAENADVQRFQGDGGPCPSAYNGDADNGEALRGPRSRGAESHLDEPDDGKRCFPTFR
jgi:hypothetical protein